jgi:hypothetical protein
MSTETMISCDALTKRFGHFTAVDHVSFSVARLNEPPEPSPGLSGAMPWGNDQQITLRPEGAREPLGKSPHAVSDIGCLIDERFSRPFRADDLFAAQSQGIALTRSALGFTLLAFQATD